MYKKVQSIFQSDRIFTFLVVFRWASLIPPLLSLGSESEQPVLSPLAVLLVATVTNLLLSVFNRRLNRLVIEYPVALGIDLVFCAGILAVSGGTQSSYYLYALSPLLAGAFFFQIRGVLLGALVFTALYLMSNFLGAPEIFSEDSATLFTQLAGIWLIPVLFAYPSRLLREITRAREELSRARDELAQKHANLEIAHRQLEIIHDLAMILQAAPDLVSVQERVLGAVTTDLGFSKAVVGLVDPALQELGGWLVYPPQESFPHVKPLALDAENGRLFQALLTRNSFRTDHDRLVDQSELNNWLTQNPWPAGTALRSGSARIAAMTRS